MSRGQGGKIKNWEKIDGKLFWRNDKRNIAMAIGQKTRRGYPVKVFGKGIKSQTRYKKTKNEAKTLAANMKRELS